MSDKPTALVVDYGGVLTGSLDAAMGEWCSADGIDPREFALVMREWLGAPVGDEAAANPVHALEVGALSIPDFERQLADRLSASGGVPLQAEGMLSRMFAGFKREPAMVSAVRIAKRSGLQTALLSNSWGLDYPREDWDQLFDEVVISGEVGLRKPDPRIYELVISKLGRQPGECVFVDDLRPNIRAAVDVGMIGVHHTSAESTIGELEAIFGQTLRT